MVGRARPWRSTSSRQRRHTGPSISARSGADHIDPRYRSKNAGAAASESAGTVLGRGRVLQEWNTRLYSNGLGRRPLAESPGAWAPRLRLGEPASIAPCATGRHQPKHASQPRLLRVAHRRARTRARCLSVQWHEFAGGVTAVAANMTATRGGAFGGCAQTYVPFGSVLHSKVASPPPGGALGQRPHDPTDEGSLECWRRQIGGGAASSYLVPVVSRVLR